MLKNRLWYTNLFWCKQNMIKKMKYNVIQDTTLRLALDPLQSTPARDLEVEACILPLHFRREEQALKFYTWDLASGVKNRFCGLLGFGHYIYPSLRPQSSCLVLRTWWRALALKDINIAERWPAEVPP